MCGICGILLGNGEADMAEKARVMAQRVKHRGPDWSGMFESSEAVLCHERLAVVDIDKGDQPLYNQDRSVVLTACGEIFNHRELKDSLAYTGLKHTTQSDCEVIITLYEAYGIHFLTRLNGMFAFILFDRREKIYLVGRDPLGIVPLYYGVDKLGRLLFASEMKALIGMGVQIQEFPPGHFMTNKSIEAVPKELYVNRLRETPPSLLDSEGPTCTGAAFAPANSCSGSSGKSRLGPSASKVVDDEFDQSDVSPMGYEQEALHEPVDEPVGEPVGEPVDEPVGEPVDESVGEPVDEPVDEPVGEPVDEPVDEGLEERSSAMSCLAEECSSTVRGMQSREASASACAETATQRTVRYYACDWFDYRKIQKCHTDKLRLRDALERAVEAQMMTDVPYGILLSGGVDSSILCALVQKFSAYHYGSSQTPAACGRCGVDQPRARREGAWWPRVHSFTVGLSTESSDIVAARKAASALGTVHHEIYFTVEEGVQVLREVIYHLETYDPISIRAGVPMFLLGKKIRALGVKMLFSGEGADEALAGYLYFHKAPNGQELHEECVEKLLTLYRTDAARVNKAMAASGLEVRLPYLDQNFLNAAMAHVNPQSKLCYPAPLEMAGGAGAPARGGALAGANGHQTLRLPMLPLKQTDNIEKHILRECFESYLPANIIWRRKEQFSDGVGYQWIDELRNFCGKNVTDEDMKVAKTRFPHNPPLTKEAYYYRRVFEELFPPECVHLVATGGHTVACSTPHATTWHNSFRDKSEPSGRAVVQVHSHPYPSAHLETGC